MTRDAVGTNAREIGPSRFQQAQDSDTQRHLGAAFGAGALLLLLVVGVPAGLLWLGGLPHVPTSLPTRDQLTATIGVDQLLVVLVWVVWLAWLQFTICVVVELRSALSGIGLPSRVPLAGPSQRLARTLVVSLLLVSTAAGQATAAVGALAPELAPASTSISMQVGEPGSALSATPAADPVAANEAQQAMQGETSYWLGDLQLTPEEGAELVGKRVYVVQPPDGRYHDNLWDIAERSLGEGRRYQEVFELNRLRDQPDGQALTLERLIYPNWLLVMPEDALAVERVTAVVTPVAPPEAPPITVVPGSSEETGSASATTPDAPSAATQEITASGHQHGLRTEGLVGAGLLAAGILVALDRLRRRRRTDEPSEDAVDLEVALRVGADPQRALLLDRGLRQLADTLRATGTDLPGVYGAVVDDDALELRLSPPSTAAPAPWHVSDTGATWRVDASDVDLATPGGPAPFPGLVSLGRDHEGRDVLIDLEAAQGPVAIVGDLDVAREVADAWAAELATNRWSDSLHVTGVELADGLGSLSPERYTASSTTDALARLQAHRGATPVHGVLTGRVRGGDTTAWVPEYLVLGAVPEGSLADRVVELAVTDHRSPLGVVCVGDLPGARWQLVAEPDGRLTGRLLGVDVQANRLGARQAAALGELFAAPSPAAHEVDEVRAAIEHEGAVDRPPVVPPGRPVEVADLDAAAVRVLVLGEPRVAAAGSIDPDRRDLATELVVFLALHPAGVHTNVLAAALWPRGVTTEVRESTITRAADWLGVDQAGRPHLDRRPDGHLALGRHVVVDWDVVCTLLARARQPESAAAEQRDLAAAVGLARGAVLSARPAGRYSWLARVRVERASRALLVDAVHRLVVLSRDGDDPAAAQSLAWEGLRLAPTDELLWRDLLRAAAALGGPEAVRPIALDLELTLRAVGAGPASPATLALLDELAPPRAVSAPGSA